MKHRDSTQEALRQPEVESAWATQQLPGSRVGQRVWEKAWWHPRTTHHWLLAKRGGEGRGKVFEIRHTLPTALSCDPEREEIALFLNVGTAGLRGASSGTKTKGKYRFSTRPSGEWSGHHLPTSISSHLWVPRFRATNPYACHLVWRGPGWAGRSPWHRPTQGACSDFHREIRRCSQFLHNLWVGTTLVQFLERFGLVDLQERHGMQGGSDFSTSCVSLVRQRGRELTRSGERRRLPRQEVGHSCITTDHSTRGSSTYPLAAPPSRVVREEEGPDWLRAEKGAFHDLVTSSCTSGKERYWGGALGTSTGHPMKPIVQPRGLRTRWRVPLEPDTRGGPGKHSSHLWAGLGQYCHTWRVQHSQIFIP